MRFQVINALNCLANNDLYLYLTLQNYLKKQSLTSHVTFLSTQRHSACDLGQKLVVL